MQERLQQGWKKAKESVPLDGAPETTETTEVETAAPETTEVTAPETTETTETTEATAPETTAAPEEEFVVNLEDTGDPATPQAFAEFLKNHPEAQTALDAAPELKNMVFGALRRDAENREIRQYVPDVATAKMVTGYASTFQRLDGAFLKAEDPANVVGFLNEWVKEAIFTDKDGKPLVGEDGKYKMHPALNNIFSHIYKNQTDVFAGKVESSGQLPPQVAPLLQALEKFAVSSDDERLQTAINVLKERISPSSSAPGVLPDELKPHAEALKAKEKELDERSQALTRQQRESAESTRHQAIDRTESKIARSVTSQLEKKFNEAGLTKFEQEAAFTKVAQGVTEALGEIGADGRWKGGTSPAAPWFQSEYDRLTQLLPNADAEKQLSKLILTHTNEILGPLASRVMREAKAGTLSRQTAKQDKIAGQTDASRVEPRGTSIATPSSAQSMDPKTLRAQVVKEYRDAHNGDDPDLPYITKTMYDRVQKAQARRPA